MSPLRGAVATALYDTFNTARLSEHPEDEAEYGWFADGFRHWLKIHGYRVVRRRVSKRTERESAAQNNA